MSKFYQKYQELKKGDSEKLYLFRMGNFYIFLDEDAKKVSKVTTLKMTNFNPEIVKCGFPVNAKEKYLEIFRNMHLDVVVIEEIKIDHSASEEKLLKKIKKMDSSKITPLKALEILDELIGALNE